MPLVPYQTAGGHLPGICAWTMLRKLGQAGELRWLQKEKGGKRSSLDICQTWPWTPARCRLNDPKTKWESASSQAYVATISRTESGGQGFLYQIVGYACVFPTGQPLHTPPLGVLGLAGLGSVNSFQR